MRGGEWNNNVTAGVFALNLNELRTNSSNNVGFRSALLSQPDVADSRVCIQCGENKGVHLHAERQKNKLLWMPTVAVRPTPQHITFFLWRLMGKYLKDIYQEICSYENLHQAYINARKCKRFRDEVLRFTNSLEDYLVDIENELQSRTYQVGNYREFYIYEPKKRLIMALPFKDRVVQWAIYQVLNPVFEKTYISHSYGCIVGRGTHKAVEQLSYWLHQVDRKPQKHYYLKLDISKYFYRVDHAVLLEILGKKIKDPDLMWLLKTIVESQDTYFGLPHGADLDDVKERLPDKGMPIGNLTSQMRSK